MNDYFCVAFISLQNSKYENLDPMTRLSDLKAYYRPIIWFLRKNAFYHWFLLKNYGLRYCPTYHIMKTFSILQPHHTTGSPEKRAGTILSWRTNLPHQTNRKYAGPSRTEAALKWVFPLLDVLWWQIMESMNMMNCSYYIRTVNINFLVS